MAISGVNPCVAVSIQETVMAKTTVMKLAVEEVTGKICRKEQKGA